MSAFDAFADLVAESIELRQAAASGTNAGAQTSTVKQASAPAAPASNTASAEVQRTLAALKQKVTHEQHQQRTDRAAQQQRDESRRRASERARRFPAWRVENEYSDAFLRAWTTVDRQQLGTLLRTRHDGVCTCGTARKRPHSVASMSDQGCCCFARLAHAARTMTRSIDDVQAQLAMSVDDSFAPSAAASVAAANPSVAPSTHAIAAQFAASISAGDYAASTSYFPHSPTVPVWSSVLIHELMTAVREVREELATQLKQRQPVLLERRNTNSKSELAEVEPAVSLSASRWSRIGASLHPPQSGADAAAVYAATIAQCGYVVPTAHVTQAPFYFPPSRRRYEAELRFTYEGPIEDPNPQFLAEIEAGAARAKETASDNESVGSTPSTTADNTEEMLAYVRRLSKRYR